MGTMQLAGISSTFKRTTLAKDATPLKIDRQSIITGNRFNYKKKTEREKRRGRERGRRGKGDGSG